MKKSSSRLKFLLSFSLSSYAFEAHEEDRVTLTSGDCSTENAFLERFPTHVHFYSFNASVLLFLAREAVFVVVLQE